MTVQPREIDIHMAVVEVLELSASKRWLWTHIPNGELRHPAIAGKLKAMGLKRGWPDLFFLSPLGLPHALELKRPKASLTEDQEALRAEFLARRLPYAVAHSVEEAINQLTRWGVLSKVTVSV